MTTFERTRTVRAVRFFAEASTSAFQREAAPATLAQHLEAQL